MARPAASPVPADAPPLRPAPVYTVSAPAKRLATRALHAQRTRSAGIDAGTAVLAILTAVLLGSAVADISHSMAAVIGAVALITVGLAVALVILRPSC